MRCLSHNVYERLGLGSHQRTRKRRPVFILYACELNLAAKSHITIFTKFTLPTHAILFVERSHGYELLTKW